MGDLGKLIVDKRLYKVAQSPIIHPGAERWEPDSSNKKCCLNLCHTVLSSLVGSSKIANQNVQNNII